MASYRDNPDVVWKVLKDPGTDFTYRNPQDQSTPLMWSLKYNLPKEVFDYILERSKEQIDWIDIPRGQTALHLAVLNKQPNLVRALLDIGARPSMLRSDNYSPFSLSVALSATDVVAVFLEKYDPFRENESEGNEKPCHVAEAAIKADNIDIFRQLIRYRSHIPFFDTWVAMAAKKNSSKILSYMMNRFGPRYRLQAIEIVFKSAVLAGKVENAKVAIDASPLVLYSSFENNNTALCSLKILRC